MIDEIYINILLVMWILLFFFSWILYFGKAPNNSYAHYLRSRKILGIAYFVFGLQIFLQWLLDLRSVDVQIAAANNLTCFYMGAILFGMSFISLLNSTYITARQMRSDFAKYAIFSSVLWGAVGWGERDVTEVVLKIGAAFFFVDTCRIIRHFFRSYREVLRNMENYYSEDTEMFIRWLCRSTYGVVVFGLICVVMAFAPKLYIAIYGLSGLGLFTYIFVSLQNYQIDFQTVDAAVERAYNLTDHEQAEETHHFLDAAAQREIELKMEQWVAKGCYKESGVTIEMLAAEIGTNRYYLSDYINSHLRLTFSEWIKQLRLEEAKRLLLSYPEMTMDKIAALIGYSSGSYFIKVFVQYEKMTPTKWRETNGTC